MLEVQINACTGRTVLPKSVAASEQDQRWKAFVSARRCDSKSRGSIYDSVAGARTGERTQASLREPNNYLCQ